MFKKIISAVLSFLVFGFLVRTSYAEQIVIEVSGNGGGSDNTVQFTSNNLSTVNQTNTADIQNNVSSDANTGNNQASSNTGGDTAINTGNASSSVSIENNNINSNNAELLCECEGGSASLAIKGNGAGSINTLNALANNNVGVIQSNDAQIVNNVNNYANSGYNQASYNGGDVTITTGKALAASYIKNKNINISFDSSGVLEKTISLLISGNGAYSINLANILFGNAFASESKNIAVIFNNVVNEANTGGNTANYNNGTVLIATGDAVSIVEIANENINGSSVEVCACTIVPPPGGGNPIIPPTGGDNPPGTPPSPSSISGPPGQVLGAIIGNVLPATGGYFLLLMTILCLTILLAGGYLRFGSGISPPLSYAI